MAGVTLEYVLVTYFALIILIEFIDVEDPIGHLYNAIVLFFKSIIGSILILLLNDYQARPKDRKKGRGPPRLDAPTPLGKKCKFEDNEIVKIEIDGSLFSGYFTAPCSYLISC